MKKNNVKRVLASVMVACLFVTSCDFFSGTNVLAAEFCEENEENISEFETKESEVESKITEEAPESITEDISGEITEETSEEISEEISEVFSEEVPTISNEETSEELSEEASDSIIEGQEEVNGDTLSGQAGSAAWEIDADGKLTVTGESFSEAPWRNYCTQIKSAYINAKPVMNVYSLFYGYANLKSVEFGPKFDTSEVTNLSGLFYNCSSLEKVDLRYLNTSNVTDFSFMFMGCENLKTLDLSSFDTKNATTLGAMFSGCKSLENVNLSSFKTSKVTYFSQMFYECKSLQEADISKFDTSSLLYMDSMFTNCKKLEVIDVSHFDTSRVKNMSRLFLECTSVQTLDVSGFDTSQVTDMDRMFSNCSSVTKLDCSNFRTEGVTNMRNMFYNCQSVQEINVSKFNTSNVENFDGMFAECKNVKVLDVSSFNTSRATSLEYMFRNCSQLESLDLSSFNTSNVTDMDEMFEGCSSLKTIDLSSFDTGNVQYMQSMFCGCTSLKELDVTGFNTPKLSGIRELFRDCTSLKVLDLSSMSFQSVSFVDVGVFSGCTGLQKVKAPLHTSDQIATWLPTSDGQKWSCESAEVSYIVTTDTTKEYIRSDYEKSAITLNYSTLLIPNGTTGKISASEYGLNWTSTNSAIATVDNTGKVSSISIGTTTVVASFPDFSSLSASCEVRVIEPTPQAVLAEGKLTNLVPGADYLVSDTPVSANELGEVILDDSYAGKWISIIKANSDSIYNSKPQKMRVILYTSQEVTITVPEMKPYMRVFSQADFTIPEDAHLVCQSVEWDHTDLGVGRVNNVTLTFIPKANYVFPASVRINIGGAVEKSSEKKDGVLTVKMSFSAVAFPSEASLVVMDIDEQIYTGKAIKPEITVMDANLDKKLKLGKDYSVSYKNNVNAATKDSAKAPTMVIKMLGSYSKSKPFTKNFTILPVDFISANTSDNVKTGISITCLDCVKADKKVHKLKPVVKFNGKTVSTKEYELEYPNKDFNGKKAYVDPDVYNVKIVGRNKNFTGTYTCAYKIVAGKLSDAKIKLNKTKYEYTGEPINPEYTITIKSGKTYIPMVKGVDYSVEYSNNEEVGKATITFTGKGIYGGTVTKSFIITGKKLTAKMVTMTKDTSVYTGNANVYKSFSYVLKDGDKTLGLYDDYYLKYDINKINVGAVTITFVGTGVYNGSKVQKNCKITPADIDYAQITDESGLSQGIFYSKKGAEPAVFAASSVCGVLHAGTDYKVTYQNNKAVTKPNGKKATVTVTGCGNFKGVKILEFSINPMPLNSDLLSVTSKDVLLTQRKGNYVPSFTITDQNNGKLLAGADYDKKIKYYRLDETDGIYKEFTEKSLPVTGTSVIKMKMEITAAADGSYIGTRDYLYECKLRSMSKVKAAKITDLIFNGSEQKPEVTLTYGSKADRVTLVPNTDYECIEYKNNVYVGTAIITIIGKGIYSGKMTVKFKIVAKPYAWIGYKKRKK